MPCRPITCSTTVETVIENQPLQLEHFALRLLRPGFDARDVKTTVLSSRKFNGL
jgi:hypothetical protein